jgi:hypothetical protein
MNAGHFWAIPDTQPSLAAVSFRKHWDTRWPDSHPRWGRTPASGAMYDHRHAHPDFRNPLSADGALLVSAEFHAAVIERLSEGRPITLATFDFENHWQGTRSYQASSLGGILDRELVWSITDPPEEDDEDEEAIVHVFITQLEVDDPRLTEVWRRSSDGNEIVLVCDRDLRWLAWPFEECVGVATINADDIEKLKQVEREIWDRWNIPQERFAALDLAQVASYIDTQRSAWAEKGVQIATEPQYRTWKNPSEFKDIAGSVPADLTLTDWLLIELESTTASATVIVHDTGAYDLRLDPDLDDEEAETLFEHRGPAESADFDDVVEVFERTVATLTQG